MIEGRATKNCLAGRVSALLLSVVVIVGSVGGAPAGPEDTARQVLKTSGIRGGLVGPLGCDCGRLSTGLRPNDRYNVHTRTADAESVQKARDHIYSRGLYGDVSVTHLSGSRLPYVDNLVNLVVMEGGATVSTDEIMRVLAPGGVLCVRQGDRWIKKTKPRADEIDEWTHFLHDPGNNAVAADQRVDHPFHMHWVGKPRQARHHEHLASVTVAVSAGGRIFSIEDRAPAASIMFPPRWHLVARDAFNGRSLWKRDIPSWHPHLWRFRQGPPQLHRRLVAVGDRVYTTLGIDAPVACLDAATGETLRTYDGTEGTEEILCKDGRLYLVQAPVNTEEARAAAEERVADYVKGLPDWAAEERGDAWDMSDSSDVQGAGHVKGMKFQDGVLSFVSERDPIINLNRGGTLINGSYDLFAVRMYSSKREQGQIYYWSPNGDWQGFRFPDVKEGWHTYYVDINKAATRGPGGGTDQRRKWGGSKGKINRFRFDPVNSAGTEVKIDWIRLLNADKADVERLEKLTAQRKSMLAVDAESGKTLWEKTLLELLPSTLAVADGRVFYQTSDFVACADAENGEGVWKYERQVPTDRPHWSAPTLVVKDGVVLSADRQPELEWRTELKTENRIARNLRKRYPPGRVVALTAEGGKKLWDARCAEGYHAPVDVLVDDGLVWLGRTAGRHLPDFTEARGLRTGEVKKRIDTADAFVKKHHHRCYRNKATSRFILAGRTGIEFLNTESGDCMRHDWVRGTCQYGILPCNGLLYAPPHSCACYIQSKLNGFCAFAPRDPGADGPEDVKHENRLVRGPAYGAGSHTSRTSSSRTAHDWPTYRHDPGRTGQAATDLPAHLTRRWEKELGGKVTPPVIAEGRVYLATIDEHTIHALNAGDGREEWRYTAGGRVDSPPTIHENRVLFGCADGWVYCLHAADGRLVWKFRAAPQERWVMAFGQVESAWPVHGNVLVEDGQAYCVAGRSSYLDSGVYVYRLDPETGEMLASERIYSRDPETGAQKEELVHEMNMGGAKPDIMSSDGESVFIRHLRLDKETLKKREQFQEHWQNEPNWRQEHPTGHALYQNPERGPHLFSPTGFLDDSWWHRSYWMYGTFFESCCPYMRAAENAPAGRIMALSDKNAYGYGRRPKFWGWWTPLEYHLFATPKDTKPTTLRDRRRKRPEDWQGVILLGPYGTRVPFEWSRQVPFSVLALVLSGDTLFAAGPPDVLDETKVDVTELMYSDELAREKLGPSLAAWQGQKGAVLWAVSAADGEARKKYNLDSVPVFDGMAAAEGRLYIATQDGKLLCMGTPQ